MIETLSEAQWAQFDVEGYVKLGRQLDDAELRLLQDRADAVMLGESSVPEYQPSSAQWLSPGPNGHDTRRLGPVVGVFARRCVLRVNV